MTRYTGLFIFALSGSIAVLAAIGAFDVGRWLTQ
jgi:hypothetical protein